MKEMTAIQKTISYLYTLTSRILRCRFIVAPQRRKRVPCTI